MCSKEKPASSRRGIRGIGALYVGKHRHDRSAL